MTNAAVTIAGCRLKELYREACRLYPYLHAVEIVDRSEVHRIGKDELCQKLLEETTKFNEYLKSLSMPGSVRSESTANYYLATCVALGLLERLGDVSTRPDFTFTSRGIVLALAQKILQSSGDSQLHPILKFFIAKILWEDDGLCLGALIEKLSRKKSSLTELYPFYSTAYASRNQFFHIMKPHVEWLFDLGLLERQEKNREAVFAKSDLLEPKQTWRGLSSSDYSRVESSLNSLFLKGYKLPPKDEIGDYVKYSYRLLETQRNQLAGDYVSASTLLDVAQLLMTLGRRFASRRILEKDLVELMDTNRDRISAMEAMTEDIGLGSPVKYGPLRVSYLRFLDREILRSRRTPNKLGINRVKIFLNG
jgi:hypothetical protein